MLPITLLSVLVSVAMVLMAPIPKWLSSAFMGTAAGIVIFAIWFIATGNLNAKLALAAFGMANAGCFVIAMVQMFLWKIRGGGEDR